MQACVTAFEGGAVCGETDSRLRGNDSKERPVFYPNGDGP